MIKSHKNHIKPQLTIAKIGRLRFFIGIVLGLSYAIIFYAFCVSLRDAIRFNFGEMLEHIYFTPQELRLFNFFIASIALTVGLYQTLSFWLANQRSWMSTKNRKIILNNLNFYHYPLLFPLFKFIICIAFVIFSPIALPKYRESTMIINHFSWIWLLIFFVLFAQQWNTIKRYYQCRLWSFYSFIIAFVAIYGLINWDVLRMEKFYLVQPIRDKVEFAFIKKELHRAEQNQVHLTDRQQLHIYTLRKYMIYDQSFYEQMKGQSNLSTRSLIYLKCAIKLGHLVHYKQCDSLTFTQRLNEVIEEEHHPQKPFRVQLVQEIIQESLAYLEPNKLSTEAFNALSIEAQLWQMKTHQFSPWAKPEVMVENGKVKYIITPKPPDSTVELVDLGELTENCLTDQAYSKALHDLQIRLNHYHAVDSKI